MFEEKVRKVNQGNRLPVNKGERSKTVRPVQPYIREHMDVRQLKIGDQKVGTNVIDEQKELYTIGSKSEAQESAPILYDLYHLILDQIRWQVDSEDERYNVYTGVIPSPTLAAWSDWKEQELFDRPSDAQFVECVRQIVNKVTKIELEHTDQYAFYNAANVATYVFHQILRIIYESFNHVQTENFEYFRAPNTSYSKEVFVSPAEYVKSRHKGWTDHSDKASLMSTNVSLLGNRKNSAEDTLDMFFSNGVGGVSQVADKVYECLYTLGFTKQQIDPIIVAVKGLMEEVSRMVRENQGMGKASMVLYQIMIPKELVSKLIYISGMNGYPVNADTLNKYYNFMPTLIEGIAAAGKEIGDDRMINIESMLAGYQDKENLADFVAGPEFTQIVLEATKSVEFWKIVNSRFSTSPQARVLLNPEYFADPDSGIQIYTHKNLPDNVADKINEGMDSISPLIRELDVPHGIVETSQAPQNETLYRRELLSKLKTLCDVYFSVKEKYGQMVVGKKEMDTNNLKEAVRQAEVDSDRIEHYVQIKVFLPLESNAGLLERCLGNPPRVQCQTREIPFDTYIPFQMNKDELKNLVKKIERELGYDQMKGEQSDEELDEVWGRQADMPSGDGVGRSAMGRRNQPGRLKVAEVVKRGGYTGNHGSVHRTKKVGGTVGDPNISKKKFPRFAKQNPSADQ